jgi:LemA protein
LFLAAMVVALVISLMQASRRFYNGNVRDYNTRCEMFPSSIIASMFKFTPADFFRLRLESEREAPRVEWE